jgi:rhamnogalacturonyl hydrolase YesR
MSNKKMERRRFLIKAVSYGSAAAVSFGAAPLWGRVPVLSAPGADPLPEKVKRAMLTMQRDAWEQGVAAQALLEIGESDLVILMAKEAVVRQIADGRLGVISCWDGVTDPAANGEPVLHAARVTGDPGLAQAAGRMLEYLLKRAPRRKDGTLYHVANRQQVWVDSMYMAPPFLAAAGEPQEAIRQIEGMRRLLWDREKKLFSHIWDDATGNFFRKDCWGVGNGWAAAGMTRVIRALPEKPAGDRDRLAGYVEQTVAGCLAHQRRDGLFHNVVDNPETFVETNLAQMLSYAIFVGIRERWLPESYLGAARHMREAVRRKVDDRGYVQGVCGSPNFESAGTATEGQAFFLLMEAAAGRADSPAA